MKKIILCATLFSAMQIAFAQQQQDPKPINPVTDQFQNGNSTGWENPTLTKAPVASVPSSVMSTFKNKYPNQTDVTWYSYDNGYTAIYTENGIERHTMYDLNGKLVGEGSQVKVETLPSSTTAYLKKNYSGKTYDRTYLITSPTGEKYYEVYADGKWIRFDSQGNAVSK